MWDVTLVCLSAYTVVVIIQHLLPNVLKNSVKVVVRRTSPRPLNCTRVEAAPSSRLLLPRAFIGPIVTVAISLTNKPDLPVALGSGTIMFAVCLSDPQPLIRRCHQASLPELHTPTPPHPCNRVHLRATYDRIPVRLPVSHPYPVPLPRNIKELPNFSWKFGVGR